MHPILLKIGPFIIYTYGVFVCLGFVGGISLFLYQAKKENLKEEKVFSFLFCIIIFSIIGARVFYILNHLNWYLKNPQDIFKIWQAGLVFYGGFIFAFIAGTVFIRLHFLPFWKIANMSTPCIALGISIGRIGCFFNGCCYGKPWDKGFVFSPNSPAGKASLNQPLIPTQLISSVDMLVIFLILIIFKRFQWFRNKSFLLFLIFYSTHRFMVEFLRADSPEIFLNLTFSQIMSVIIGSSAGTLVLAFKKGENENNTFSF